MSLAHRQNERNDVIKILSELKPSHLSVRDAKRFEKIFAEGKGKEILARSQRVLHSVVQPVGLAGAALLNGKLTRRGIHSTAQKVSETKAGECHTLAQLAADHLLKKMEAKEIHPRSLNIVTYENSLYSHTFVVLGYLNGVTHPDEPCLIIDLWAAALGYDKTQGVFTFDDYPYPDMLSPLRVIYDNSDMLKKPLISQTIATGSHPIYRPPVENKEVIQKVTETIAKKYPNKLDDFIKTLEDSVVLGGLKILAKKFKDPSIVSLKILGLFEQGLGKPLSPVKYTEFREEERPCIAHTARALHDAYLMKPSKFIQQSSR